MLLLSLYSLLADLGLCLLVAGVMGLAAWWLIDRPRGL